jgi:hypothetical protein
LETEVETSQANIGILYKSKTKYEQKTDTDSYECWKLVASTSQEIVFFQTQIVEKGNDPHILNLCYEKSKLPDIAYIHVDGKFHLI